MKYLSMAEQAKRSGEIYPEQMAKQLSTEGFSAWLLTDQSVVVLDSQTYHDSFLAFENRDAFDKWAATFVELDFWEWYRAKNKAKKKRR